MEHAQLKAKKSSEGSLGSQESRSTGRLVQKKPERLSQPRSPGEPEPEGPDPTIKHGNFFSQELTQEFEDDEDDIEGLTIGPITVDSMNNIEVPEKKRSQVQFRNPLEVEVLVYTLEEVREDSQKVLEEDDGQLGLNQPPNPDTEKIKELKEKLGKANVPTRNPYISSTTFDVQFQLEQAQAEASGRQAPETSEKKVKKPSFWRRLFRGFHRRISVVLPSGLKKVKKTRIEA